MDKVDFSAASLFNVATAVSAHPGLKQETKKTKSRGEIHSGRALLFSGLMENSAPEGELGPLRELSPSDEALTELMDAVHSAGSDLKERPYSDEILRYKKAVRDFMHYVIENGYEMQKIQGIKRKTVSRGETEWKPAIYYQVRVIDQKLEELAAAILSGQTSQLERVSKIDEITGLLVDLTVSGEIRARDD